MRIRSLSLTIGLIVVMAWLTTLTAAEDPKNQPRPNAKAAQQSKANPSVAVTETGQALLERYAAMRKSLQVDIAKAVPSIESRKATALEKARNATKLAMDQQTKAQQNMSKLQQAQGLVEHAKGKWIGGAEKGIAQAQTALKQAKTDAEREAAKAELAKWQQNKEDGIKALKERQAALDTIKADEPMLRQASKAAAEAAAKALADELAAADAILADVKPFLSSDKLDAILVKATVLSEATPLGLAQFAQQGREQEALVEKLLADTDLMKEMLIAGGAANGKYAQAMQILADIRKASTKAAEKGLYHRLATATSLAHAVPIAQRNAEIESNTAPTYVDPVKRYLHYEKAHLNGELDPAFPSLTTWEYRFVVDSYAPDEMLAWGREMLRNYRPDHIFNSNYGWRYSGAVRTDVAYRHSHEYKDSESLGFFQNVCKNGGICGRRAFFGRYIVQAFGLPARPFTQHAHAAMVRWTPEGWVVNLGAGWPSGWFPEQSGPEFLLQTQARKLPEEYIRVLRAEWINTVLADPKTNNKKSVGMWKQIAQFEKKAIVAALKPAELAALGSELAEANESVDTKAAAVEKAVVTDADKKVSIGSNGEITIPVAACGGGNHLVKSFLGGLQMICGAKPITCVVEVPEAGKYKLTARVVTVHGDQSLPLTVNDSKTPVGVPVPFTIGAWQKTEPVEITLVRGKNTFTFAKPSQAFAMKDITLTPIK